MNPQRLVFLLLLLAGSVAAYFALTGDPDPAADDLGDPGSQALQRETLDSSAPVVSDPEHQALVEEVDAADAERLAALELNRQALALLEQDAPEQAVLKLREALLLAPDDPVMALNLSRSLVQWAAQETALGRHDHALTLLGEAVDIDPDMGLPAYWIARVLLRRGDREDAREVLDAALVQFPDQAGLLQMSANLAALEGHLVQAVEQMSQAVALQPDDSYLKDRLGQLQMEEELFRTFLTDATSHFESRYDPRDTDMVSWIPDLQRDLEEAWTEVVQLLGIQPQQRILVLWLDPERYRWRAPDWSSGLYDGRIRIVIGDYPNEQDDIRRTLRHELTHAVLHSLGTRLPTWLQEGMAQIAEGRDVSLAREALGARLPLRVTPADLDSNWTSWTDRDKVAQAYFYSMAMCAWLEEEYATGVLHTLFHNVRGRTFDEGWAMTFGQDFETVERRHRETWKNP